MVVKRLTLLLLFALIATVVIAKPERKQLRSELNEEAVQQRDSDGDSDEAGDNDNDKHHQDGSASDVARPRLQRPQSGGNSDVFEQIPDEFTKRR
uniref:Chimadanin anti-thrombin-like protein n=1 Tax=Rhipicephalus zambeziensis TaxID=60191 RepID=A0A224YDM5_9ACAR